MPKKEPTKKKTGRKLQKYIVTVSAKAKVIGSAQVAKMKKKASKAGMKIKVTKTK